jgi:phage tail protein X
MSATYTTKDGDTVDYVVFQYYGHTDKKAVEQVLEANPGLADRGPLLPYGVQITLPALVQAADTKGPRLWT